MTENDNDGKAPLGAGAPSPLGQSEGEGAGAGKAARDAASAELARVLRETRAHLGLTGADVAESLKLSVRQIEAMDNGEWDKLPDAAFARGFLKNYARHLGVADRAADLIDKALPPPSSGADGDKVTFERRYEGPDRSYGYLKFVAWAVAAVSAIYGVYAWQGKSNELNERQNERAIEIPTPSSDAPTLGGGNTVTVPIQGLEVTRSVEPPQAQGADGQTAIPSAPGSEPAAALNPALNPVLRPGSGAAAPAGAPGAAPLSPSALVVRAKAGARITISDASGKFLLNSRLIENDETLSFDGAAPFVVSIYNTNGTEIDYRGVSVDVAKNTWKNNTYMTVR